MRFFAQTSNARGLSCVGHRWVYALVYMHSWCLGKVGGLRFSAAVREKAVRDGGFRLELARLRARVLWRPSMRTCTVGYCRGHVFGVVARKSLSVRSQIAKGVGYCDRVSEQLTEIISRATRAC